jgi:hypothetical protein
VPKPVTLPALGLLTHALLDDLAACVCVCLANTMPLTLSFDWTFLLLFHRDLFVTHNASAQHTSRYFPHYIDVSAEEQQQRRQEGKRAWEICREVSELTPKAVGSVHAKVCVTLVVWQRSSLDQRGRQPCPRASLASTPLSTAGR